jgi:hypothetical protein
MSLRPEISQALGGIADLDSLVPNAFCARFDLGRPGQYGMVCRDVRAGIEELEALGSGPFLHVTTSPPGWTERGMKKSVVTEMALGYADHQQIELLGPGKNTDLYSEKIPSHGGINLHHVGFFAFGIERLRDELPDAGYPVVVDLGMRIGPLYSVAVSYFDTREELGFYLEILDFRLLGRPSPLTEGLVSGIGRVQKRFRTG